MFFQNLLGGSCILLVHVIVVGQKCKNYIWELPCGSYLLEVPAVLLPSLCFPWSGKKEGWGTAAVWPIWVLSTSPCSPNIFEPSIFGIWVFFFLHGFWFSGDASRLVLAIIDVCLGNYWSVKLFLKLLDAEILQESRPLGTEAFSKTRDHGRDLPCHVRSSIPHGASCCRTRVILTFLGMADYLHLKLKPYYGCTLIWYKALVHCLVIISL